MKDNVFLLFFFSFLAHHALRKSKERKRKENIVEKAFMGLFNKGNNVIKHSMSYFLEFLNVECDLNMEENTRKPRGKYLMIIFCFFPLAYESDKIWTIQRRLKWAPAQSIKLWAQNVWFHCLLVCVLFGS